MKLSIRSLRWICLVLYILVIASLTTMGLSLWDWDKLWTLIGLGVMIVSQAVFLLGAGTFELCRPIRRRRLLIPIIIASLMIAVLAGVISLSFTELFKVETRWTFHAFWGIMILNWIIWGFLLFIYSYKVERYRVIYRLTTTVLTGSVVELLAGVPSHIIVSRRPGCFVGLYTMVGIIGGVYVMLWAFGPGVILMFLREKRQNELGGNNKTVK